ncbi:MAG TPA: YggT family protein [Iamia sp.]
MGALTSILCVVCLAAMLVLVATVITSWFAVQPGTAMESVARGLRTVTEPVLGPLRRVLPQPRLGGGALDLSPLVVLLALQVLRLLLGC